jgi:phosphosulfolactate synthase
MDYSIPYIPDRPVKPRESGITMMMDKGLSVKEAEEFARSSGDFTDFVKLGFGTALITKDLDAKLDVYRDNNIRPYFGGTLFEAFYIRECLMSTGNSFLHIISIWLKYPTARLLLIMIKNSDV